MQTKKQTLEKLKIGEKEMLMELYCHIDVEI